MNNEQTLSIIKPDAVERNLVDDIKNIFIKNNLNIKESKKIHITKEEASEFYKVHQSKPFYINLSDDTNSLKQKTQKLEHKVFPEAIIRIFRKS